MADLGWDRDFALEQSGEDEELLGELLSLLRDSSDQDLEKIKQALAAGDGQALADAAHNSKGAAASLGIEKLRQLNLELEQAGKSGDIELARKLFPRLEAMIAAVKELR